MSSIFTVQGILSPPLEVNAYVICHLESRKAAAVDPGFASDAILQFCRDNEWELESLILTHGHIDHTHDVARLKREAGVPVICHAEVVPYLQSADVSGATWLQMDLEECEADRLVKDGEKLAVGDGEIEIIHTPGHTPGCICLLGDDFCITGDLLFRDGVGRWDFPGGNQKTLIQSLKKLRERCCPEVTVYPGHGPATTLKRELEENPYLVEWLK
ncbi:MAG: MBL fold metallo-hydrolase [Candidatus Sumerlaeia bacterium]